MNRKLLSSAFLAAATLAMSHAAAAADGTINISGSITGTTCTINGSATANNFPVSLPPVSTTALGALDATAGRTAFSIRLTGCSVATGNVHSYFEPGTTVDTATGNLINAAGAGGVQVQLLNGDATKINVGFADASQNSKSVAIAANAATLPYYAQYVRTGALTAGAVNTSVMYSLVYN